MAQGYFGCNHTKRSELFLGLTPMTGLIVHHDHSALFSMALPRAGYLGVFGICVLRSRSVELDDMHFSVHWRILGLVKGSGSHIIDEHEL